MIELDRKNKRYYRDNHQFTAKQHPKAIQLSMQYDLLQLPRYLKSMLHAESALEAYLKELSQLTTGEPFPTSGGPGAKNFASRVSSSTEVPQHQ